MPSKVYVIGVGMTKFEKPGSRENFDYPDMAREAGQKALKDAGVTYNQIEQAYVGYVYGDSTSGQAALYELGMSGIPIVNVNNNCSTGSTALMLAKNAVEAGQAQCVLALGFEKMQRGSLSSQYEDRVNPIAKHVEVMSNLHEMTAAPMMAQMFGNAGLDYLTKHNLKDDCDVFARIAHKNHKHSVNNPYAQFRKEYSLDEIKNAPMIHAPLTKLQCSPTSDGSAAVVVASEAFVRKHGLQAQAIEILAIEMATDLESTFKENCTKLVGFDMSQMAARKAFAKSGITPQDVQVVELHDCFSANELITYDALGLCAPGKAVEMVRNNDNTYGGKVVVNPSGGLISKGHPLGATGLAQCSELTWQLRGQAEKRQVANVKYALQHNIGLGGAAVVGIYKLGFPAAASSPASSPVRSSSSASGLQSSTSQHKSGVFFDEIEQKLKSAEGAVMAKQIGATIGFEVKCDGDKVHSYIIDLKKIPGSVNINEPKTKAECTITINDSDLMNIMDGKLNMMSAFTQKKLKLAGNMSLAMKLNQIFSSVLKDRKAGTKPAEIPTPNAAPASTGSSLTATTTKHKSGKLFEDIEQRLSTEGPELCKKVNAVIGFKVAGADKQVYSYIVDLQKAPGAVLVDDGKIKAGCTISIGDDDLLNVIAGKLNMIAAFTQKKLKITGNMSIAMKLNTLFAGLAKPTSKL